MGYVFRYGSRTADSQTVRASRPAAHASEPHVGAAFNACFSCLSLLDPLSEAKDLGVLVVAVDEMRAEVWVFGKLFLLCVIAFTCSFVGLGSVCSSSCSTAGSASSACSACCLR